MKTTICPRISKCRLVNNSLLNAKKTKTYIKSYCESREKWLQCKRHIVAEELGQCPDFVLPDTPDSVFEIFDRIEEEKTDGTNSSSAT